MAPGMPRDIEQRLRRLERMARRARERDPAEICQIALECYNQGVDLPANMSRGELSLARCMLDTLVMTEPDNWWIDLPLPIPAREAR